MLRECLLLVCVLVVGVWGGGPPKVNVSFSQPTYTVTEAGMEYGYFLVKLDYGAEDVPKVTVKDEPDSAEAGTDYELPVTKIFDKAPNVHIEIKANLAECTVEKKFSLSLKVDPPSENVGLYESAVIYICTGKDDCMERVEALEGLLKERDEELINYRLQEKDEKLIDCKAELQGICDCTARVEALEGLIKERDEELINYRLQETRPAATSSTCKTAEALIGLLKEKDEQLIDCKAELQGKTQPAATSTSPTCKPPPVMAEPPVVLSAIQVDTNLTVSWVPPLDLEKAIGYVILGSSSDGSWSYLVDDTNADSAMITNLYQDAEFSVRMMTLTDSSVSSLSEVMTVAMTVFPPTDVIATLDDDVITVHWTPPWRGPTPSGYDIHYKGADKKNVPVDTDSGKCKISKDGGATECVFSDDGITEDEYSVTVVAITGSGKNESTTVARRKVFPPTNVHATLKDTTITVTWTKPTTGHTPTKYDIYYKPLDGDLTKVTADEDKCKINDGTATRCEISHTSINEDDYIIVMVTFAGSLKSEEFETIVSRKVFPPTDVSATLAGDVITVHWTKPAGGRTPTGYEIHYKGGDGDNIDEETVSVSLDEDGSYEIKERNQDMYDIKMRTVSNNLRSAWTTAVSADAKKEPEESSDDNGGESTGAYFTWVVVAAIVIVIATVVGYIGFKKRSKIMEWVGSKVNPGAGGGEGGGGLIKYHKLPQSTSHT